MVGAEPIVARNDRAQPIRTREAWRTQGGPGWVRTRPLAAGWPKPSPRACWSHAGSQTPGTGHPESWETVPSHPTNFFTGLGLNRRVGACRGRVLTWAGDRAYGWARVRSLP